jgi:hypothetical protein
VFEKTDEGIARAQDHTALQAWLKAEVKDIPESFEKGLLNWIVYDCQAFVVTESKWFKRMLRARGYTDKVIGANIVKTRLTSRVENVKKENTKLFATLASTVAVSLDG